MDEEQRAGTPETERLRGKGKNAHHRWEKEKTHPLWNVWAASRGRIQNQLLVKRTFVLLLGSREAISTPHSPPCSRFAKRVRNGSPAPSGTLRGREKLNIINFGPAKHHTSPTDISWTCFLLFCGLVSTAHYLTINQFYYQVFFANIFQNHLLKVG